MEERVQFLEKEFNKFDYKINPYHIQPGLLLDVDITSIKRKKATLDGMANVLNEFLHGVSKGFQDAAFAAFSRRRSTVREDIDQQFGTDAGAEDSGETSGKGQGYLDMLNSEGAGAGETETVVGDQKKSGGSGKGGAKKKSTSSKKSSGSSGGTKKRGRPKKNKSDDGLKSL